MIANHQFTDQWKVSTTARYTESGTSTREHWATVGATVDANGNVARTIYTADAETRIFNLDARLQGVFDLGMTKHQVLFGVDRQDALWEQDNYFSGRGLGGSINIYDPQYGNLNDSVIVPKRNGGNQIEQIGVYAADHIEIGPLVLSAALRHDWAKNTALANERTEAARKKSDESETTGRLGALYRFENGFSPYVSYAGAFTMNLGSDGTPKAGTLKPTTGVQREYGFKYLSDDKSLGVTFAYFDITQNKRIQQGATPGGVSQVGATIDGWELQVNKRWKQFETQFAYTDMNADDASSGERLPFVAEKIASWWNKYYFATNWRVGAGVRYIGTNVGSGGAPEVPSETLYDAMLGYSLMNWDFSLDAKNLTDEEYVSWCRGEGYDCGFGERRNVTANVRYHF